MSLKSRRGKMTRTRPLTGKCILQMQRRYLRGEAARSAAYKDFLMPLVKAHFEAMESYFKIGDGKSSWADLPPVRGSSRRFE